MSSVDILPCRTFADGSDVCEEAYVPRAIARARILARVQLAPMVALLASASVVVDRNDAILVDAGNGLVARAFDVDGPFGVPLQPGASILVQTRF